MSISFLSAPRSAIKPECLKYLASSILILLALIPSAALQAETLTQNKIGNLNYKLDTDSASEGSFSLEGKSSKVEVLVIENPLRLVVDVYGSFRGKSSSHTLSSPLLNSLRIGIHPDKLRFVIDVSEKPQHKLSYSLNQDKSKSSVSFSYVPENLAEEIDANKPTTASSESIIPTEAPQPAATYEPTITAEPTISTTVEILAPTAEPTLIPTVAATVTFTPVVTFTPTATSTSTATPSATSTKSATHTATASPTFTLVAFTPVPTQTASPVPTLAPTLTPVPTVEPTQVPTIIPLPTETPVILPSVAATATPLAEERVSQQSEQQQVTGLSFDYQQPDNLPIVTLATSQRPSFKLIKRDDGTFTLSISDCDTSNKTLKLPQFPPQDFLGFRFIQVTNKGSSCEVLIGVDKGTRVAAFAKENSILIRSIGFASH